MSDIPKAELTLKCTKCGHLVPSPSESTSDDTLVICPACGADLGTWGEAKRSVTLNGALGSGEVTASN
jgi:DNA-directed RNA polymerase subunit RPC12/RpoP